MRLAGEDPWRLEFTKLPVHEVIVKPGEESALGQVGGAGWLDGQSVCIQGQVDMKN